MGAGQRDRPAVRSQFRVHAVRACAKEGRAVAQGAGVLRISGGETVARIPIEERFHAAFVKARAFADWSFKFVAWLVLTATVQYIGQSTNKPSIFTLGVLMQLLLSAVLFLFVVDCSNVKVRDLHPVVSFVVLLVAGGWLLARTTHSNCSMMWSRPSSPIKRPRSEKVQIPQQKFVRPLEDRTRANPPGARPVGLAWGCYAECS